MTLHSDALASLRGWTAPSTEQESLRQRYVAHLEAHPDGMTRGCCADRLTASALVLSADLGEVLLTLHAKAREWFQLGGRCVRTATRPSQQGPRCVRPPRSPASPTCASTPSRST